MKLKKKKLDQERKFTICKVILIMSVLGSWAFMTLNFELPINNEMKNFWIHAPSIVEEGEKFNITVEAWDKFERLAGGYVGGISFNIESYNYSTFVPINPVKLLPPNYTFTSNYILGGILPAYKISGADNGKKSFRMEINTTGIHYLVVEEIDTHKKFRSNPIIVKPKGTIDKRLFWGDIHGHTLLSDGSGLPTEAYEFARDVAKLDFAALTDHSEYFPRIGDIDMFNTFQKYINITNSFNNPGKFVTLVAMEWTPDLIVRSGVARGHLNFYFEGNTMPFFSTLTHQTPDEIYAYLRLNSKDKFLAWSHHTNIGQFGSDFAFYDEEINRLIEIYSVHGSSETYGIDNIVNPIGVIQERGFSIRDALRMGRKCGIMASSDTHDGRLGHSIGHTGASAYNQYPYNFAGYRLFHNYKGGMTGVFSPSLTRSSIFNSLYNRSCYGTTWVNRHYIDFSINGTRIGMNNSTLHVLTQNSHRELNVMICADGISMNSSSINKIKQVSIYKNSEMWYTNNTIDNFLFKATILDKTQITGTNYNASTQRADGEWYIHDQSIKPVDPNTLNTGGFDYYYLRMLDSNDGAAWIGPIWVEYP